MLDGTMSHDRLVRLLVRCLDWIESDNVDTLDTFQYIGLEEDEIEALGFGYLLGTKEDEEDDN